MSSFPSQDKTAHPLGKPDIEVDVREVFGIDIDESIGFFRSFRICACHRP